MANFWNQPLLLSCLCVGLTVVTATVTPKSTKPGSCPYVPIGIEACIEPTNVTETNQCTTDSQCPGIQKCCKPACLALRCVNPVSPCVCPYVNPAVKCFAAGAIGCNSTYDCFKGQHCCATDCGGSACIQETTAQAPSTQCPATNPLIKCAEPSPSRWGCRKDQQCKKKKGQKCCMTNCQGKQCVQAVKVGNCPSVNILGATRNSNATCSGDSACPFEQKCCPYGHLSKCQCPDYSAEFTNPAAVHADQCPDPPPCASPISGGYTNECQYDAQCPNNQKCCEFCGLKCRNSVK
jgi:hypothetical protein